ncbi:autotransporter domain-containing protein [Bradyrhizobium genosp. L]|uniref:autotransporter domain-containing SGNH/GDSL hydrolase family protein n=1 Tax=Bradyrhizobium genosp. L TaxID=83637 RepID=UPI0018A2EC68|nr:autotransporter domain-containing protein [Bradyrhizobium genosp. L]QPF86927.1 autotransporter domain-containing protein [Bradyrhizobium genosp. L]
MTLKSVMPAAALLLAAGMPVAGAQAQQLGTIYGFGDSLLDVSRNCPIAFPQSAPYGACGNGKGTLQWLPDFTSYSFIKSNDYAYNGVGNGVFPAFNGGPTVAQQIVEFTSAGRSFQPNDLIVVGGMPNNWGAMYLGLPDANGVPYTPQTLAAATLSQQYGNFAQLIKAGGHNFIAENMFASSTYNWYYIGGFFPNGPPYNQIPDLPIARQFFGLVNDNLAATLAPLAAPGVRIHIVDLAAIYTRAYTDPASLGFKTGTACIFDGNCLTASKDVQNQHFMYDLHPTEAGYAVIARYEANLLAAQDGLAAQGDLAQITAQNFSNAIFARLDAYRFADAGVAGSVAAYQAYASMDRPGIATKAPPARLAPEQPLSVYMAASYGSGSIGDRFSADGNARGFDYTLAGGTVGADVKINPDTRIGIAFNYTNPVADLSGGTGHLNLDSYQVGGFASFTYPHLLTDIVATYGHHVYQIDRPGVIDTIRGSTSGDSFTAGFKSAYLFDVGQLRVGPLVGLTYDYTTVNPYTETGDPIITQFVARQTLEGLTGSAGVQLRAPFVVGTQLVSSYLNLTAEHDFLSGGRTLLSAETVALALPIYTLVPGNPDRTYGKIAGGLSTALAGNVSAMLTAAGTFGNSNSQFALQGAVKVAF